MEAQLDIRITAPALRDTDVLELALEHAADVIYAKYPRGGPCVAGNAGVGGLSMLVSLDTGDATEWQAQVQALIDAVAMVWH